MRLVRPSVRPSVCPVEIRNSKTKTRRKIKIGIDVPVKWSANFQFEKSKVKVTGREKPPKSGVIAPAAPADQVRHC